MTDSRLTATLRSNIEAILARKNMSMAAASTGAGLGVNYISQGLTKEGGLNTARLEQLAVYLGIDPHDLFAPASAREAAPVSGFAEAGVKPFIRKDADAGDPAAQAAFDAQFQIADDSAAGFGLLRGDLLEIALRPSNDDGALVIATIVERQTGTARSVIGRRLGPYLLGPDFGTRADDFTVIDNDRVSVVATVLRSLRPAIR